MDNEVSGNGNQYDYGFRIYNPRIGRFLSVDPLTSSYPMLTPYQFASNTPIQAIDLDGLEAKKSTTVNSDGSTIIKITIDLKVKNSSDVPDDKIMKLARETEKMLEKSLTLFDRESNIQYITEVNLVQDQNAGEGDFYLDYVPVVMKDGRPYPASGKVDEIGNTEVNRFQVLAPGYEPPGGYYDVIDEKNVPRTGGHEVGHGLGGEHAKSQQIDPDKDDIEFGPENLMYAGGKGNEITPEQMKKFVENINEEGK